MTLILIIQEQNGLSLHYHHITVSFLHSTKFLVHKSRLGMVRLGNFITGCQSIYLAAAMETYSSDIKKKSESFELSPFNLSALLLLCIQGTA